MKIQLTASLAVLFLALIGPKGTLGSPIEQRVGKEESKSVDTNEDHAIPYRGAHHGPIAAVAPDIGADESISVPSYSPLSDGGCGYTSEERMFKFQNGDVHGNFSLFELKALILMCFR